MQYDSYSQEETHMVQAIVGANWGDEGKGKITDMLAEKADIIVRFQGGANAGHTIVTITENLHCIHFRQVYFTAIRQASLEMVLLWIYLF